MSRFPMPMNPNGWYHIGVSSQLAVGQVKAVKYFNRDLVLFRGEDGKVCLLDAYCAHLGANLGIGGKVVKNTIQCPFHAWCYDGTGQCVEIPYAQKIPPRAKVQAMPVMERNGLILAYYHAEGKAPDWEVPDYGVGTTDEWEPLDTHDYKIRSHCQEIGENVTDTAHFAGVHKMVDPEMYKGVKIDVDGPFFNVFQHMKLGPDSAMAGIEVPVSTKTCGPGVAVLGVSIGPVETLSFINQTPIDDEYLHATINFTMKKLDDRAMSNMVRQTHAMFLNEQYTQDIPIWENKVYKVKPNFCDGDGPIPQWRRWYKQFYTNYVDPAFGS